MEWLSPLAALIGVYLGAHLGSRSDEVTRLRNLRIDRSERLLHAVSEIRMALGKSSAEDVAPDRFQSDTDWARAFLERLEEVSPTIERLHGLMSEFLLLSSDAVRDKVFEILQSSREIARLTQDELERAFTMLNEAPDDESRVWPYPIIGSFFTEVTKKRQPLEEAVLDLERDLVVLLRKDLGVDPVPRWPLRRWRARLG